MKIPGLDRYLTQEPPSDEWWFEAVVEKVKFFPREMLLDEERTLDKWLDKLYTKYFHQYDKSTIDIAANIISRAIKIYYK